MKRIGSTAKGGIIAMTPTKGPSVARTCGMAPMAVPRQSAVIAAMASPITRRCRLAAVSCQSRMSPERRSGSAMRLPIESASVAGDGSSLSSGLTASRASLAAR